MESVHKEVTLEFHFKGYRVCVDHADKVRRYIVQEEGIYGRSWKNVTAGSIGIGTY